MKFLIEQALLAPLGDIIEVGVYNGGSMIELAGKFAFQRVIGFDTFAGLPSDYWGPDEVHEADEFGDTNFQSVRDSLEPYKNARVFKGLFPDDFHNLFELMNISPAFVHLDMDHWRGTLAALGYIWPILTPGGSIVFDDYEWKNCPGIAPMVHTWASAKGARLKTHGNQAVITKMNGGIE